MCTAEVAETVNEAAFDDECICEVFFVAFDFESPCGLTYEIVECGDGIRIGA